MFMNDWIGLAVIVLIVIGGILASAKLGTPRKRISEEEFAKRAREGAAAKAGLFALQQLLNPKAAEAVAVQQDLRHGYYNKKKIPGEGEDEDEDAEAVEDAAADGADAQMTEAQDTEDARERDA